MKYNMYEFFQNIPYTDRNNVAQWLEMLILFL